MKSPTKNTLDRCRASGWQVDVAEYWNQYAKKRMDLFGFIDIVALVPPEDGGGVLGIQATSASNVSARVKKITTERSAVARAWLESGGRIQVWGWSKKNKRGADGRFWQVRIVEITERDIKDD